MSSDLRFDRLLAPESVAVIGSLSAPDKLGARTVDHLRRAGFGGAVQAIRKVDDLVGDVDVAVVAVPAAAAADVLTALRGRAAHAVVYSSGFGEAGADGLARFHDDELAILGPNTVGLYVASTATALAFAQALGPVIDELGRVPQAPSHGAALVTQSGALGARLTSAAAKRGVAIGTFVATGNEDGYTIADVLEGLARSAVVNPRVVLVYLEAVREAARLQAAVRTLADRGVEVLALLGGRSATGASAATSHTAALVADAAVLAEALGASGATVVDSDRELLDGLVALTLQRRAIGRRAAVLTGSGGAGVVLADLLSSRGVWLPPLGGTTRERLAALLPPYAGVANPIDVTASVIADLDSLAACAAGLAASDEVDMIVTVARAAQAATVQRAAEPLPTIAAIIDATTADLRDLADAGILAAGDLTSAADMAAIIARDAPDPIDTRAASSDDGPQRGTDDDIPPPGPPPAAQALDHPPSASESLQLVAGYGIAPAPWRRASTMSDARRAGDELGWPVVLKADLPAHVHKAAAGGVRLDVTPERLPAAYAALTSAMPERTDGAVIVATQRRGSLELFAGARTDPHFGLVVVAGLGGSHVELLGRTVSAPATVSPAWFARRIEHVAFHGAGPPGTAARLAAASLALARLVHDTGADVAECNPLIDTDTGLIALDARVVLP